jgi:hypothetical protein
MPLTFQDDVEKAIWVSFVTAILQSNENLGGNSVSGEISFSPRLDTAVARLADTMLEQYRKRT